jgi:prefoldin subunit 5
MCMNEYSRQLQDGIDEMEATIERLREEIKRLTEQRDALQENNLELYRALTRHEF